MSSEGMGFLNLPRMEKIDNHQFSSYHTRLACVFRPALRDFSLKSRFIDRLEMDPRVISMRGKFLNFGCGQELFDFKRLAMWFLWMINEHGEKEAVEALNSYLDDGYISLQENLWVSGFKLNEVVIINEFISMVPLKLMPFSEYKNIFSTWPTTFINREHEQPEVCIVANYRVPKFSPNEETRLEERISLIRDLHKLSELINLFNGISCFNYILNSSSLLSIPYGIFHTSNGSRSHSDILGFNNNTLVEISGINASELLLAYWELPGNLQIIIDIAISRLSQAKRRKSIKDKLLDLGIALDSLLILRNERRKRKKISDRGSSIAKKQGWDINIARSKLMLLYDLRSDVVHNGFINNEPNDIFDEIKLVEDIIRELIFSKNFYWR